MRLLMYPTGRNLLNCLIADRVCIELALQCHPDAVLFSDDIDALISA